MKPPPSDDSLSLIYGLVLPRPIYGYGYDSAVVPEDPSSLHPDPESDTADLSITIPEPGGDVSTADDEPRLAMLAQEDAALHRVDGEELRDASGRFRFRRKIGAGGFGEVWEAWDNRLDRTVAVKLMHPRFGADDRFVELLRREARVASQLIHPAIVAVHDLGMLPNGHPFIVMEYVDASPWDQEFAATSGKGPDADRAFSALMQLVEGLAFGHVREVAHRDIKPGNVLVSSEQLAGHAVCRVRIVDWGLACLVEAPNAAKGSFARQQVGTPAYIAPEIEAGGAASLTADIYSLGVMLHELIWGHRPPEKGRTSPPSELLIGDARLAGICADCIVVDPSKRIARADALLRRLRSWWRSWQRRGEVSKVVSRADAAAETAALERARMAALQAQVHAIREQIHSSAPEEDKLPLWALEDELRQSQAELHRLESDRMTALLGALAIDPAAASVRTRLADLHLSLHREAEAAGDSAAAARHLATLSTFDDGAHGAYIRGTGTIRVTASVTGARVEVRHLVTVRRRLEVGTVAWSGPAGATSTPIPAGRYAVTLTASGWHPARLCVRIGRNQRWSNGMVDGGEAVPIRMVRASEVASDEVYIPGGPHLVGDPSGEGNAIPSRRVHTEPFVMKRYCVTVGEYIAYLDALVRAGRRAEALERAPQQRGAADDLPLHLFGEREDGTFFSRPDADGDPVYDDHPVTLIRPRDAEAYAAWLSEQTGHLWRLPFELEWEKAARSADGRRYPFGDHIDASWVRCIEHHAPGVRLAVARVTEHPSDRSCYGVMQLAGNVFEMTASVHRVDGPLVGPDGRWTEQPCAPEESRVLRGGAWGRDVSRCLSFHRTILGDHRSPLVGFRLVRTVPPEQPQGDGSPSSR